MCYRAWRRGKGNTKVRPGKGKQALWFKNCKRCPRRPKFVQQKTAVVAV